MDAIPEQWLNCRESEFVQLRRILGSSPGVIHLHGPRGCGKTEILRDLCHGQNPVTVDATLSTSVPALMSCILRRVHDSLKTIRNTGSPESDEEMDAKDEEKLKKEESPLSTPDKVPSRSELMEECANRGTRRNAAIVAQKKIVALGKPNRGGGARKLLDDDFLDEDYSEESESSSDSSEEESEPKVRTARPNQPRSTNTVPPNIYRILARAQRLRVRGVSAFIQKFERVLIQATEPTRLVLIIENVDSIVTPEDRSFDLNAVSPGVEFLTLLTRLDEYISIPMIDLSIVLTSAQLLPPAVSSRAASISLHPYTLSETVTILSRRTGMDKSYHQFVAGACAILYPAMCNNFVLLRDTVERLYEDWNSRIVDIKRVAATSLTSMFNENHHDGSFASDAKAVANLISSTKWLSQDARRMLVASYLASHNPAQHDKQIFRVLGNDARARKQATSQFKKYRNMADSIDIRTPVPFPLSRLLSIYRYLSGAPEEDANEDAGYFFYKTVRELTQNGLLKAGGNSHSNDWWIQGGSSLKLNCNAPFNLIEEVAKKLNIKLDEVLYA